ncbi:MAG: hypothetical protein IAC61_02910 [Firmicutes bacterium]|uniref:Uncharacterized protein n=1 Tax=Candidatus Alloenteromonas pullistercoris TaxID=2840785 RepID=A0A9D9DGK1_9FIRM|nr:hypothetical protein [Candidatus Enteromonas pullistercoris]
MGAGELSVLRPFHKMPFGFQKAIWREIIAFPVLLEKVWLRRAFVSICIVALLGFSRSAEEDQTLKSKAANPLIFD